MRWNPWRSRENVAPSFQHHLGIIAHRDEVIQVESGKHGADKLLSFLRVCLQNLKLCPRNPTICDFDAHNSVPDNLCCNKVLGESQTPSLAAARALPSEPTLGL